MPCFRRTRAGRYFSMEPQAFCLARSHASNRGKNWLSGRMWPLDNRCCLPPCFGMPCCCVGGAACAGLACCAVGVCSAAALLAALSLLPMVVGIAAVALAVALVPAAAANTHMVQVAPSAVPGGRWQQRWWCRMHQWWCHWPIW